MPSPEQSTTQEAGGSTPVRARRPPITIEVNDAPDDQVELTSIRRHTRAGSLIQPLPSSPLTPRRRGTVVSSPSSSQRLGRLSVDLLAIDTPAKDTTKTLSPSTVRDVEASMTGSAISEASLQPSTPLIAGPRKEATLGALHLSARQGNLLQMKMLLRKQRKKNVDVLDSEGWTPLMEAAFCLQDTAADMVQFLLDNGADIHARNHEGNSITHIAAFNNSQGGAIYKYLLGRGEGKIDLPATRDGQYAIHIAAHTNNIPGLKVLLESKAADVNMKNASDYTALHLAANAGLPQVVEVLLQHQASVHMVDINGGIPLHHAALSNSDLVVSMLLKAQSVIDKRDFDGSTPLQYAASSGCLDAVKCLLRHGADPNLRDENGHTSLHHAVTGGNPAVIQVLLDSGAYRVIRGLDGRTSYDFACVLDHPKATKDLLFVEKSPLIQAIEEEDVERVRRIVKEDPESISRADETGWTPVFSAVLTGRQDILAMLTARESNVIHAVDNAGVSALHYATANGNVPAVSHLLEMGLSSSKATYQNRVPAHFAARNESLEACLRLVEANPGVWKTCKDAYGHTPLSYVQLWEDQARITQVERVLEKALQARQPIGAQEILQLHTAVQEQNLVSLKQGLRRGMLEPGHAQKLLIHAVEVGWLDGVKLILSEGTDPNCKNDTDRDTPLHISCRRGHVAIARELLDRGARHGVINKSGDTPLNVIRYHEGQDENKDAHTLTAMLIRAGADVMRKDAGHMYPLHHAAGAGAIGTVELLVQAGANPTASVASPVKGVAGATRQVTAFDLAMDNGHVETARKIVPEAKLVQSVIVGDTQDIAQLVAGGAHPDETDNTGNSALHLAVIGQHVDALRELTKSEEPYNINICNDQGMTPLHVACQMAHSDSVSTLVQVDGINPNFHGGQGTGVTPLHVLPYNKTPNSDIIHILDILHKKGVDPSSSDASFITPLHNAAAAGDVDAVKKLLDMGADPTVEHSMGRTPYDLANLKGHAGVVQTLRDITPKVNPGHSTSPSAGEELFSQLRAAGALSDEGDEGHATGPGKDDTGRLVMREATGLADVGDDASTSTSYITDPDAERRTHDGSVGADGLPRISRPLPGSVAASPALVGRSPGLSNGSDMDLGADHSAARDEGTSLSHIDAVGAPAPASPALQMKRRPVPSSLPNRGSSATDKSPSGKPSVPFPTQPSPARQLPQHKVSRAVRAPPPVPHASEPSLPKVRTSTPGSQTALVPAPTPAVRVQSAPSTQVRTPSKHVSSVRRKLIDDLESANPAPVSPAPAIRRAEWIRKAIPGESVLHGAIRRRASITEIKELLAAQLSLANAVDSRGQTPLHAAVHMLDLDIVRLLVSNGAEVDPLDKAGRSPLLEIDYENQDANSVLAIINYLASNGADINRRDGEGMTLIQSANLHNQPEIVSALIKHGAAHTNAEATNRLWHAIRNKDEGAVLGAIVAGANCRDVDKRHKFSTVLHEVSSWCSGHVIQQLIAKGACVDARDIHGETAMHRAAQGLNASAVKVFGEVLPTITNGPDADQANPIHHVNFQGNIKCVRDTLLALLDAGATIDAPNRDGRTALHLATLSNSLGAAKLLLERGASANRVDHDGKLPYDYANRAANPILHRELDPTRRRNNPTSVQQTRDAATHQRSSSIEITTELNALPTPKEAIEHDDPSEIRAALIGIDVNKKGGSQGATLLHEAVLGHKAAAVRALIDRGADLDATDRHGITPLHVACATGQWDMVALLLISGADLECRDGNGSTPLHVACTQGHNKIIELLLSKGANFDAHDNDGRTPVYLCSTMGNVNGVKSLLQSGADVMLASRYGTPLESSQSKQHMEVWKLLSQHAQSLSKLVARPKEETIFNLHQAVRKGNERVVEALLANSNFDLSTSTLPLVFDAVKTKKSTIVELLLEAGASPTQVGPREQTPLHVANANGDEQSILLLLEHGADPTSINADGNTAFDLALKAKKEKVAPPLPSRPRPPSKTGLMPPPPPRNQGAIPRSRSNMDLDKMSQSKVHIGRSPSFESLSSHASSGGPPTLPRGHAGAHPKARRVRRRSATTGGPAPAPVHGHMRHASGGPGGRAVPPPPPRRAPIPRPPPRPRLRRRDTFTGQAQPPHADPLGEVVYQNQALVNKK